MKPLISICLPVYNGQAFLFEAIESALNQTYENIELIISDDCSTDASHSIATWHAERDSRVRLWRNSERLGLFANYNACMGRSTGEFIKPHAQDDLLHSDLVARCYQFMSDHPDVVLVGTGRKIISDSSQVDERDKPLTAANVLGEGEVFPAAKVIDSSLFPLQNFIGEPCAVMFRRQSIGDGFSTRFRHLGDLEYWLRMLRTGNYGFINSELVSFRRHQTNATTANLGQLWIASDIVHMAYACGDTLDSKRVSKRSFVRENLWRFSHQVAQAIETEEVNEKSLRAGTEFSLEDVAGLREALFHSLWMSADLGDQSGSELPPAMQEKRGALHNATLQNEQKIKRSEALLRTVLHSSQWKATRIFREINQLLKKEKQSKPGSAPVAVETPFDRQLAYLAFLKQQRRSILRSRSWKIGKIMRQAEKLAKQT